MHRPSCLLPLVATGLVACGGGEPSVAPAGLPVVTAIAPLTGLGSTSLTISGTNLAGAIVRIGGEVARVTAASATTLQVDLCNASGADCEPRGSAAGGGALPVTVSASGQSATAPNTYLLHTSATFLGGEWETEPPSTGAGIVTRINAGGSVAVVTRVPASELLFTVGDTVNRALAKTAAYRWSGRGLIVNQATLARVLVDVTVTADGPDALIVSFASGGTTRRKRLSSAR